MKSSKWRSRIIVKVIGVIAAGIVLTTSVARAQSSSTDGQTPLGLSPGAPAGSYALTGFDNVNLYNGNLNFSLPLLSIGGRGDAQTTMVLTIEQRWRVDHNFQFGIHAPVSNWWTGIEPGYGPGVLQGRQVTEGCPEGINQTDTLTRLTFTAGDGTEFELRDQLTGGDPESSLCPTGGPPLPGASRGTVFITADGSSATFVSDTPIDDDQGAGQPDSFIIRPTGFLMMRSGTRYRIVDGLVVWMRDRNGNRISFSYDGFGRIIRIVDSLSREVIIDYDVQEGAPYGLCDRIRYEGFGEAQRIIRISKGNLANALRSGQGLMTFAALFPDLDGSSSTFHNPIVKTAVWLPDGRSYQFQYNSYGELARVVVPTGGAIEYDYDSGVAGAPGGAERGGEIYRRVMERRVYADGFNLEGKMIYARPAVIDSGANQSIEVEHRDATGILLAKDKHYYHGNVIQSFRQGMFDYATFRDGREYRSEVFGVDGTTVIQRTDHTWVQRAPVSWWPFSPDLAPPNDPRIAQTLTALDNKVSKQVFSYDQYNNRTEVREHDFGTGAPAGLRRLTQTQFLTVNPVNGIDYATDFNIHIRDLPALTSVFDGNGLEQARTTYEYDRHTTDQNHAALLNRTGISGLDSSFTSGYQTRGNATAVTRWLLPSTQLTSYQQYDVAGNIVKTIDARGNASNIEYADRFGAPDGSAAGNAPPAELAGLSSFALPTRVINSLGHATATQYDYHTGRPVDAEDANGVVSSAFYNDPLDRPTQIIAASNQGTAVRNQTTFSYNDFARLISTTRDLNTFGDNLLGSAILYDGLGRTVESRVFEPGGTIVTKQRYDGMGRPRQASNPYRPSTEVEQWTTTAFDGLSRTISVTTPDGAIVSTSYLGNETTVTDQADKVRRSVTDGLGRLIRVDEPNANNNLDAGGVPVQSTSYSYDALDNLIAVAQGNQTRSFTYDSLSRLTQAMNPESGTMAYQYDANSNLMKKTDARGVMTSYAYDSLNRVRTRSYSGTLPGGATPPVSYDYDDAGVSNSKGRMTSVSSIISNYTYGAFDALGRVLTGTQTTNGQPYAMSYGYDLAGNTTSESYPSGRTVSMSYDRANRLAGIAGQKTGEGSKTYASQFKYASHGGVAEMQLGNSLWEHMLYNNRLQPTQIGLGTTRTTSEVLGLDYTYGTTNNNGNVLTQKITVPGLSANLFQSYSYDSLNRLEEARENQGTAFGTQYWRQRFIYDRYGNRNFDQSLGQTTPNVMGSNPVISQANNRIDVIANPTGWGYDPTGNLTMMPDAGGNATMEYDGENRQVKFTKGGGAISTYSYDGDGRRVKRVTGGVTTIFVYNVAGQLVAEYDDATSPPPGSGGTSYLTTDHLGSTRVVTGQDQSIKARHDYLPFGEEIATAIGSRSSVTGYTASDPTRQRFTQKERDSESGLDYFLARYYSGPLGRFTSPDEFTGGPDELYFFVADAAENPVFYADLYNPQSLNKYQYTYNNPLRYIDPDGHAAGEDKVSRVLKGATKGAAIGAGVGAVGGAVLGAGSAGTVGAIGGTLVAPGPGTVGGAVVGGVSGGVSGAIVGAGIGAIAGGIIGSVIEIFRNDPVEPSTDTGTQADSQPQAPAQTAPQAQSATQPPPPLQPQKIDKKSGKPKKDRSPDGTQNRREEIEKAQTTFRKRGQPERIRDTSRSRQEEKAAMSRIKRLKDLDGQ